MNIDRFKRRVWDKERQRMHYGDMDNLMVGLGGMLFWQFGYDSPRPLSPEERENYIQMDSTGRKDSEGTLVYEGDIIEGPHDFGPGGWATRKGVVEWSNLHGYQWEYWQVSRITVLGNIYESPSLLEADKK